MTGVAAASGRLPWLRGVLIAAVISILVVAVLQAGYAFALIALRAHTDMGAIRAHMLEAYDTGVIDEHEHPRLIINRGGHQFTECAAWSVAMDDGRSAREIALMPQLHFETEGPCGALHKSAQNLPGTQITDYSRYWHGYRLYLWPMIEAFSLQTVRFVNAFLILCAVIWFFVELRASIGRLPALVFFIVLMSLTDIWRIWVNTPHTLAMLAILGGSALFARLYRTRQSAGSAIVAAAILGSFFNYIDFLSNPPMAPAMMAFFVLAMPPSQRASAEAGLRGLPLATLVALSWLGGYAMTWVLKWVLTVAISPDPHFAISDVLNQIELRTYGQEHDRHIAFIPLLPTATMILQSFISVGTITVAILTAAIVRQIRLHWAAFDGRRFLRLCTPALIPMIWFELLSNHTQTHSHFTYRSESAAIAIIFAAAVMALNIPLDFKTLLRGLLRRRAAASA